MTATLKKIPEKETPKITMEEFILSQDPGPKDSRLVVCPLWSNFYRLNYWGDKKIGKTMQQCIVHSMFVRIVPSGDTYCMTIYPG